MHEQLTPPREARMVGRKPGHRCWSGRPAVPLGMAVQADLHIQLRNVPGTLLAFALILHK